MIEIRTSNAVSQNPEVEEMTRQPGESNLDWLKRAVGDTNPAGSILLLGGTSLIDFRLRVAQSHARRDLLPSFWSHVGLLGERSGDEPVLYEVSLEPVSGFGRVAFKNAVQEGSVRNYADPNRYPNIAVISLTMSPNALPEGDTLPSALVRAIDVFQKQRSLVDLGAHLVAWLAFAWGVGGTGNPLLANKGVPSAVLLESVFAIAGIELTPGVASSSSCPEAIWQSAKWWHEYYASEATLTQSPPQGKYVVGQPAAATYDA